MLEEILFKIIHYSLVISLAALLSISYPTYGSADSLWKNSKSQASKMLFTDTKATFVGDIVTIIISEQSTSGFENGSKHEKKSNVLSSITNLLFPAATATDSDTDALYQNRQYTGSRAGMHNGTLPSSKWDATQKFEGDGTVDTKSSLEAKIAARVIAVLENDHLLLEGKKTVRVGQEEQTFILSGIARREDIGPDNTIQSQYLANAKIQVDEKGPVMQSQKKGVLTKLWEFIGLY